MADIKLTPIPKDIAIEFIQTHHYSKVMPRLTKHYLGAYGSNKSSLLAVITLGWGTQPLHTIRKVLYKNADISTADYFEIGKMCFIPRLNGTNFGTVILAKLMTYVRRELPAISYIYTLADGIMGKCGYVYQASNFRYIGNFMTSVYKDDVTGEKVHPRSARQLCIENAAMEGKDKVFWLSHDFCIHKGLSKISGLMYRYIYPVTRRAAKSLKKYPGYGLHELPYPKEDDLLFRVRTAKGRSECIEQPSFNLDECSHNYQKY